MDVGRGEQERKRRGTHRGRGYWKNMVDQERPAAREALADAMEERKGWRRQNRPWKVSGVEKTETMVTPPSGCNFSVVWFSLTTCGQHGLATTWLEGRGRPRNGKLCSTKQMYPLFHFLRRTRSQKFIPTARGDYAIMAKVSRSNKTSRVLSRGIIVQLRNNWNKVDEEATE